MNKKYFWNIYDYKLYIKLLIFKKKDIFISSLLSFK